jgi:hypothetical protein
MLDAYTVRKAIPRVVLAVIAINLSIYLCIAALDITMIIGRGMHQLLVNPFLQDFDVNGVKIEANAENSILGILGVVGILGSLVAAIIVTSAGVAAAAVGVLGLLLPLIITISLIILAVLFTLVIRQGLLIFLIIVSPVAFACYILPGTEKYFKQWLDLFTRTLMVYPIIAAIFAMSSVLGAILLTSASGSGSGSMIPNFYVAQASQSDAVGTVQIIVAILVLYLPLVLIPFAFKLAGGAISAIANAATGRAGNLAGRAGQAIQKSRQDPTSYLGKKTIQARDNRIRKGITTGQLLASGGALARGKGLEGARTARRSRADIRSRANAREAMQNNAHLKELAFDDNGIAVMALSGGTREGAARAADRLAAARGWNDEQRDRALATASAVGFSATNTMGALDLMAQNKSRALADTLAGDNGMDLVRESARAVSGGNEQAVENIMGGFAYNSRNAGRLDLGGESAGESVQTGWNRAGVGQHMQSFGASMEAYTQSFGHDLHNGTDEQRRDAAVAFAEMHGGLPQATAENQDHINEALQAIGVDYRATRTVAGAPIRDANGNQVGREADRVVPIPVDEQLANLANGLDRTGRHLGSQDPHHLGDAVAGPLTAAQANQAVVSANEVRSRARAYGSAQEEQANLQQQQQQGQGQNNPNQQSDRRLKRNIIHVSTTRDGIKLYRFQYIWSDQIYVGVMAQDLTATHPDALSKDSFGYYRVDYSVLGLRMQKYEDWVRGQNQPSSYVHKI